MNKEKSYQKGQKRCNLNTSTSLHISTTFYNVFAECKMLTTRKQFQFQEQNIAYQGHAYHMS